MIDFGTSRDISN